MSWVEPPRTPDDTQPNTALRHAPGQPGLRRSLLLLIIGLSLTLSITLLLLLNPTTPPQRRLPLTVYLQQAGAPQPLYTTASTIAELLREQGITLAPEDTIAPAPELPLSAGMQIIIERARPVTITADQQRQTIRTTFVSPLDILRQAGITLQAEDRVWVDGVAARQADLPLWVVPPLEIVVRRAFAVTIHDGDQTLTIMSAANTIGDVLFEAGITLVLADTVTPDTGQPLDGPATITITRAQSVTIAVDGTTVETRLIGGTVADALAQAGIALTGLDYVMPAAETPLAPGITLRVIRITEVIETEDEPVPYTTVYQADANLELDTRQMIQAGQPGIRQHRIRVRYEDGVEIAREPDGSSITQPPQAAIIAYGTRIVLRTIDTPEGPREYWRKLRVYATSYKPAALGGDDSTALGMKLEKGMIAADPRLIPWRTALYVPDYGLGIMGDTGGARRSRYWIDLGYSDADYRSWHWYTEVYLLTPVPAKIPYLLPDWAPP